MLLKLPVKLEYCKVYTMIIEYSTAEKIDKLFMCFFDIFNSYSYYEMSIFLKRFQIVHSKE
jgi:hypothetical protein